MTTEVRQLDTVELKQRVRGMYEEVALKAAHEFHFETGRPLVAARGCGASSSHDAGVGLFGPFQRSDRYQAPAVVRLGLGVDRLLPEDAVDLGLQPRGGVLVEGRHVLGRLPNRLPRFPHRRGRAATMLPSSLGASGSSQPPQPQSHLDRE